MKFSSKLALVAVASLVSVSAFAVTDLSTITDGADLDALSIAELKAPGTTAGDGSVALISQTDKTNLAYILQEGALNYAVILQGQVAGVAQILQKADNNVAYINQK